MSSTESGATVLVVDDEPDVADAYALRLEREYDVRTAYGGEEALETIDDEVQIVLLDRRMPDRSGDEVLEEIRERGYDCGVIMVTAVDPDFGIIDMPFDDYLQKPVERETLFEAIEDQIEALDREAAVSELFSVTAKAGVLEQRKTTEELEAHPQYEQLKERARELRQQLHGEDLDAVGNGAVNDAARVTDGPAPGADEGDEPDDGATRSDGLLGRIRGLIGI